MSVYFGTEKISLYAGGIAGENVTNETSQQIDIISGLAVVTNTEITTPTGTNKEKLQINNTNLQGIKTNLTHPTEFKIISPPNKIEYQEDEALDLTGLVVTATFNDGTSLDVTSQCTITPANGTVLKPSVDAISIIYVYNSVEYTASQPITVTPNTTIYGVSWDGTSTTAWSRTDAAELFTNPVPYVSGASSYSSPFDRCSPWKDMQIVNDATAGKLVSIPKYYYKWTKTGNTMKLQIADGPADGFHVSPAHADRGDGRGERDVVYVGRYHCNSSYKSAAGSNPLGSMTRATARTNIHNLGSTYWQYDFAMYWTICMLYLVEFADWNSQTKIGHGCSTSNNFMSMGYTDSMPYHTGTTASSRTSYGGTQYRYIEGLWDNVYDWCDGIYFSGANIYCIKNPSSFSDSSGGTHIGTRSTSGGWIKSWNVPTASGFEYALYPATVGGSDSTYTPDYCYYGSSGVVLLVGGGCNQGTRRGLFYLDGGGSASYSSSSIGCRLQKLP